MSYLLRPNSNGFYTKKYLFLILYYFFPRITDLLKKKKLFCLLLYFLFEDTKRNACLADDEKRTVHLRFYRVFRRAVVPHAMAV